MPIKILMPMLSPTMSEGKIVGWYKKVGDRVFPGDAIAEIETDKAIMDFEVVDEGVIAKIIFEADCDRKIMINEVVAILQQEEESDDEVLAFIKDIEQTSITNKASANNSTTIDTPIVSRSDKDIDNITKDNKAVIGNNDEISPLKEDNLDTSNISGFIKSERIFATPLAKKIAKLNGLDLRLIKGTGPRNRIIRSDVLEFINVKQQQSSLLKEQVKNNEKIRLSGMRSVIARRLLESKQSIPHFYLSFDLRVDKLIKIREALNSRAGISNCGKPDYKISINDFIVKIAGMAMKKFPAVNAKWCGDYIEIYEDIDVAVAVALPGGLITPIVRCVDTKGMVEISQEIQDLVVRAKNNALRPIEFEGGGITISNLGMLGVEQFTAIINPPQACIVAVGAIMRKPVIGDGDIIITANVMNVTLSCDHRVIDGAEAGQFFKAFKDFCENPETLIL